LLNPMLIIEVSVANVKSDVPGSSPRIMMKA